SCEAPISKSPYKSGAVEAGLLHRVHYGFSRNPCLACRRAGLFIAPTEFPRNVMAMARMTWEICLQLHRVDPVFGEVVFPRVRQQSYLRHWLHCDGIQEAGFDAYHYVAELGERE